MDVPVKGVKAIALVRASEEHISQFELIKYSYPGVAQPVRPPENEETAAKRGAVRVDDPMDLASKRLAEFPQGALAHPPEGSSWSSYWVYGDGLLAIDVDPETKVIRELSYVLGPAGESPVFLPLNRIHLTDGEMFMQVPPATARTNSGPEAKNTTSAGPGAADQNP